MGAWGFSSVMTESATALCEHCTILFEQQLGAKEDISQRHEEDQQDGRWTGDQQLAPPVAAGWGFMSDGW